MKYHTVPSRDSGIRNFPCKNPKKVMTLFLNDIVVKNLELQAYRMESFWGLNSDYDTVKSTVSDVKLILRFRYITLKIRF